MEMEQWYDNGSDHTQPTLAPIQAVADPASTTLPRDLVLQEMLEVDAYGRDVYLEAEQRILQRRAQSRLSPLLDVEELPIQDRHPTADEAKMPRLQQLSPGQGLVVEGKNDEGKPRLFMPAFVGLDCGAERVYVSQRAADHMHLPYGPPVHSAAMANNIQTPVARVLRLVHMSLGEYSGHQRRLPVTVYVLMGEAFFDVLLGLPFMTEARMSLFRAHSGPLPH